MQTICPNCSNRLVVDDAKVPATPFMLKCPKCQGMVKVPGRGAQPAPPAPPSPVAAAPAPAPAAPAAPAPSPGPSPSWSPPTNLPPPGRVASPPAGSAVKALVALAAKDSSPIAAVLERLGFAVEAFDAPEDKAIRLQQGDFAVVVTERNGVPEDASVYRMVQTLPLEIRRRVFLVLVGDDLQTGEGTQAFALVADLVVSTKDAAFCDRLLAQTLHERKRIYQTFWDAEDRKAEGKL